MRPLPFNVAWADHRHKKMRRDRSRKIEVQNAKDTTFNQPITCLPQKEGDNELDLPFPPSEGLPFNPP